MAQQVANQIDPTEVVDSYLHIPETVTIQVPKKNVGRHRRFWRVPTEWFRLDVIKIIKH